MNGNLACARARIAVSWLATYEDDRGPVGDDAGDPLSMFTQAVVIAAFVAGFDQAEGEFAIERATGQTQLDNATALMREASNLFRGYARHHEHRAECSTDPQVQRDSLLKARRNVAMAVRLLEWLGGADTFTVAPDDDGVCGVEPFAIPAEIAANGDLVPVDVGKTREDCRDRFGNVENFGGGVHPFPRPKSNVRPVTAGPLANETVADCLIAALRGEDDDAASLSMATATVFRLQTPDPRFDPTRPVLINGFSYHPATEA